VGFETILYYLIINTIKDLYCDVLREIATTCNFAVTNCHGNYSPHLQSEILPKSPSPFEIKIISIRTQGFEPGTPIKHPFSGLMAVQSEGVICPLPRMQFAAGTGDSGFVGDWWRIERLRPLKKRTNSNFFGISPYQKPVRQN
jgi:hypothetical protein